MPTELPPKITAAAAALSDAHNALVAAIEEAWPADTPVTVEIEGEPVSGLVDGGGADSPRFVVFFQENRTGKTAYFNALHPEFSAAFMTKETL